MCIYIYIHIYIIILYIYRQTDTLRDHTCLCATANALVEKLKQPSCPNNPTPIPAENSLPFADGGAQECRVRGGSRIMIIYEY